MCVCVCFSSFFDSRVSIPSRHAQITSRLKSRKIFGEDCFLFSVYYFDTMIIFKIQIFSNGLIFTSFSWERKRNDRNVRLEDNASIVLRRGRHSLTPARGNRGGTGSRINRVKPPGAVIDTKYIAIAFNYRHLPPVKNKIATVTRGTEGLKGRGEKVNGKKRAKRRKTPTRAYNEKEGYRERKRGNGARENGERRTTEDGIAGQALVNYTPSCIMSPDCLVNVLLHAGSRA